MRDHGIEGALRRERADMELVEHQLAKGDAVPARVCPLEGIRIDAPFFAVAAIPEHAYGLHPTEPTGTITVRALLVARADLDEEVVHGLTASLFDHKATLANEQKLLSHLTEDFDRSLSPYAPHPGADAYFRRSEPTFVQRYTDQISLFLTVGALLWSGFTAWRGARKALRRGRIEEHLATAQKITTEARVTEDVAARRACLDALRRERDHAVLELAAERLDANEAFTIFQQYVDAQIRELEATT